MSEDAAPVGAPPKNLADGIVKALRPRQWVKNVLVLAAPLAAGSVTDRDVLLSVALAFIVFCFAASGGARMQEALISLMQMAKTSAVLARLREEGIPFISVLTDPVYGGVSASLAMLGDVIVGEPKALIGFAGPRVIEQTVREKLPEGFQRSEFLLEHGAIDMIIARGELRPRLGNLLAQMMGLPTPVYIAPKVEPIVVPPVPANL